MSENPKTNGHQKKYDPSTEYEYLGADVWAEKKTGEKKRNTAYTQDILDALEQKKEEDDESSEEDS